MAHQFWLDDMTCGHCVLRLTKALHAFDPAAQVSFDLTARKVSIDGTAGREDYARAIRDAGYSPDAAQ
jgi:copper chaperone